MFGDAFAGASPEVKLAVAAAALSLMALEYGAARLARAEGAAPSHDLGETAVSLLIAVGGNIVKKTIAALIVVPYFWVYEHRLFDVAIDGVLPVLALFLGVEFCYYWMHRAAHRVRWMWATHRVHHSPTKLNLTAAVRLGWTGAISGNPLFFLPMVWLGFHPLAVLAAVALNLVYQFWLHTDRQIDLGPLEHVLNTPKRHQVHHARNAECLDKNFGGTLIVYDWLFGTLGDAPRDERLRYGLAGEAPSNNPLKILFGEWVAIFRDIRRAPSLRAALRSAFGPPGASDPTQIRPAGPRPDPRSQALSAAAPLRSASPKSAAARRA